MRLLDIGIDVVYEWLGFAWLCSALALALAVFCVCLFAIRNMHTHHYIYIHQQTTVSVNDLVAYLRFSECGISSFDVLRRIYVDQYMWRVQRNIFGISELSLRVLKCVGICLVLKYI